jgi:hypothetical protein
MAAKFTAGDSIASTKSIQSRNRGGPDVKTRSMKLRSGSTMPGMPGSIRTGANTQGAAIAKKGKGGSMTEKRGGPGGKMGIGKKGSSGPFPKTAPGTMAKNAVVTKGARGTMESLRGATAGATMSRGKGKSVMY